MRYMIDTEKGTCERVNNFPCSGREYYYILPKTGIITKKAWENSSIDIMQMSLGNAFETRDEAAFYLERAKVLAELKKYALPMHVQTKCAKTTIYWNKTTNSINYGLYRLHTGTTVYFGSLDLAYAAVRAVGERRLKKYYFCVE